MVSFEGPSQISPVLLQAKPILTHPDYNRKFESNHCTFNKESYTVAVIKKTLADHRDSIPVTRNVDLNAVLRVTWTRGIVLNSTRVCCILTSTIVWFQ